ncbi:MAG: GIY-YIG nuclease family protein [Chiayiivirga sp.]|jgi:hypothetical protein|nr:GIY-YIG nuclease family protein [Chiayiivirga sp.]
MAEMDDDELLSELGVEAAPIKSGRYTPRQERIIAGFEDILRFHEEHGRAPEHGDGRDIFERLYAVRLDQLRVLPEARELLADLDIHDLLGSRAGARPVVKVDELDDEALLNELGVDDGAGEDDIKKLRHVSTYAEKRAAEDVADREPCKDFDRFQSLFEQAERQLKSGERKAQFFRRDTSIVEGNFFILGGQMVYVAEVGETIKAPNGENDARLRVIYSNGTESNLLRRSLQRALYKDKTARSLSGVVEGPLFGDEAEADDIPSGTIYVLRSRSAHPYVAAHRQVLHKIGVTGGKVETRIANAVHDATYLLAEVEVVATYKLSNLNRTKLENLFHRLFAGAQVDLTIQDRFGHPVKPREWFLVPLPVIDEAVRRIVDGSIVGYSYDVASARLLSSP